MALIKAVSYKGSSPFWWVISEKNESLTENITRIVIRCYLDSDSYNGDVNNHICDLGQGYTIPGINLTVDNCYKWLIANTSQFADAAYVEGSYKSDVTESPVILEISDDIVIPDCKRKMQVIKYINNYKEKILVVDCEVLFYPKGYENEEETTLRQKVTFVTDNFFKYADTEIGEYDYFKEVQTKNNLTDDQILTLGLQYADKIENKINSKLNVEKGKAYNASASSMSTATSTNIIENVN
jgi:hypothetical protein